MRPKRLYAMTVTLAVGASSLVAATPAGASTVTPDAGVCTTPNSGYVCIWRGTSPSGTLDHLYYNYNTYNITNPTDFGNHSICNQQFGGAQATLYAFPNGIGNSSPVAQGCHTRNLSPYASIKLSP
jgi:hypothetical protein